MRRQAIQKAAFAVVLTIIAVPPLLHHAFGVRRMPDWGMMGGIGLPLREARFFAVADGKWLPLDYGHLLPPRAATRPWAARLATDESVKQLARRLCVELGAGADVRALSRVGRRNGWTEERRGESNLCAE